MSRMMPRIGPLGRWQALVDAGRLSDDPVQRAAAGRLQALHEALAAAPADAPAKPRRSFLRRRQDRTPATSPRGLYLYGPVGRGKSMLMDLFFEDAPVARKRRVHFHAFMQEVHAGITEARQQGLRDPVARVAGAVARQAALLCFDELQITDIADAMIVGRLFEHLFERGVVVVTTSNHPPVDLYRDGLNRALFLPFIALIEARMEVWEMDGDQDHRLARLKGAPVWFSPLGAQADAAMAARWTELAGGAPERLELRLGSRRICLPAYRNGVGRASFADLCEAPLGPAEYLLLADRLRTLMIDRIPVLSRARYDAAKRFMTLIDALYEARRQLIASAEAAPDRLYVEGANAFEFHRTASRLVEMQSEGWAEAG